MWVIITHIFYYIPSVGQLITSPIANDRPVSSSPLPVCFHQPISDDAHAVCGVYRQMARCKTHFRDISSPNSPPPLPNTTYLLFNREPASRRFAHTFVGLHFDEFESQRLKRHTHKKQHRWHTHKHMLRGVYTTECTVIYWKGVSVLFSYASRPPPLLAPSKFSICSKSRGSKCGATKLNVWCAISCVFLLMCLWWMTLWWWNSVISISTRRVLC